MIISSLYLSCCFWVCSALIFLPSSSSEDTGRVAGGTVQLGCWLPSCPQIMRCWSPGCTHGCRLCASCGQVLLLSQDYGKHLLGVEDLLQKHALVEADIGIQAERVRGVNASAQKFATDGEGKNGLTLTVPPYHQRPVSRDRWAVYGSAALKGTRHSWVPSGPCWGYNKMPSEQF